MERLKKKIPMLVVMVLVVAFGIGLSVAYSKGYSEAREEYAEATRSEGAFNSAEDIELIPFDQGEDIYFLLEDALAKATEVNYYNSLLLSENNLECHEKILKYMEQLKEVAPDDDKEIIQLFIELQEIQIEAEEEKGEKLKEDYEILKRIQNGDISMEDLEELEEFFDIEEFEGNSL